MKTFVAGAIAFALVSQCAPGALAEDAEAGAPAATSSPASAAATPATAAPPAATTGVDQAQPGAPLKLGGQGPGVLRAAVLLDRIHFSPGEIDGRYGHKMRTAVKGFQKANGLRVSGAIDSPTWSALTSRENVPALVDYRISETDVAGPFAQVPRKMEDQAGLPYLGFASVQEALGERFHIRPAYLQAINPGKDLARAGEPIMVPNVDPPSPLPKGSRVVVKKSTKTVSLVDDQSHVLAQFPASMGSRHDPLPLGHWKINGVSHNPKFHYNPKLFWDAKAGDSKSTLQPGPNNPVGMVWIDLSKKHYGIHGTPEPRNIGRTESHGCIRLSNWDALLLSQAVRPGMPAWLVP